MAKVKFKKGDKVEITGNSNEHMFPTGTVVKLLKYEEDADDGVGAWEAEGKDLYNTIDTWWVRQKDIKLHKTKVNKQVKTNNMNITKQNLKDTVEQVANSLMGSIGRITTLELRDELRVQYPHILWNQYTTGKTPGVSDLFHELVGEGKFRSIADNGTYQTYVPTGKLTNQLSKALTKASGRQTKAASLKANSAPAQKAVAKVAKNTLPKLSRSKALKLIQGNKGRFFTAVFTKKDNTVRTINGQYLKDQDLSQGYIKVREASKMKTSADDSIRQINLQTLKQVKIGGVLYQVK